MYITYNSTLAIKLRSSSGFGRRSTHIFDEVRI